MPIGDGLGGDGVAFSRSLGGDYPVEEFTIVMLTYDREAILIEALKRLSGMKYLNKIVVVWNHPVDPAADLEWPDVGVDFEVRSNEVTYLYVRGFPKFEYYMPPWEPSPLDFMSDELQTHLKLAPSVYPDFL